MSHGHPWTAVELARIHKFQLQVGSARLGLATFWIETCEFCASSIAVHHSMGARGTLMYLNLTYTQRIIQTVKSRLSAVSEKVHRLDPPPARARAGPAHTTQTAQTQSETESHSHRERRETLEEEYNVYHFGHFICHDKSKLCNHFNTSLGSPDIVS